MRSTATFEPDVSSRFQRLLAQRKQTRKTVLNEVMRRGLDALEQAPEPQIQPFKIRVHLGGGVLDRRPASEILGDMEAEAFLEKHARIQAEWEAARKT